MRVRKSGNFYFIEALTYEQLTAIEDALSGAATLFDIESTKADENALEAAKSVTAAAADAGRKFTEAGRKWRARRDANREIANAIRKVVP